MPGLVALRFQPDCQPDQNHDDGNQSRQAAVNHASPPLTFFPLHLEPDPPGVDVDQR